MGTYQPVAQASFSTTAYPNPNPLCIEDVVSRGATAKSGGGVIKRGQIVGIEAASGKIVAADATNLASAIKAEDEDATAADAACIVYVGGIFRADAVLWPATGTHAAVTDQLRDMGIFLESVVSQPGTIVKSVPLDNEEVRIDDTVVAKPDPNAPKPKEAEPLKIELGKEPYLEPKPGEYRVMPGTGTVPVDKPEKTTEKHGVHGGTSAPSAAPKHKP
jgi:hypothetical protein